MKEAYDIKLPRHPAVWWSRIAPRWPVIIWILAVVIAWRLYTGGIEFAAIKGVVEKHEESVAPVETGRITDVLVRAGDHVSKGQVLARLDTSLIDAEIALEKALRQEAIETFNASTHDILRVNSQFNQVIGDAEAALATERRLYTEVVAELGVLRSELSRLKTLVADRIIPESDITSIKARAAALEESAKLYPQSIEALETRLSDARSEKRSLMRWLETEEATDYEKAIDEKRAKRQQIHDEQLKLLMARRKTYTLHASRNGMIARVFQQKGDVVGPQVPVLAIVESGTSHVVAFLPEGRARDCHTNMTVHVASPIEKVRFKCKVVAVAPDIVWLPLRVSPAQNQGQGARGRRITLRLVQETNLLPGETVDVFFMPSQKSLLDRITGKFRKKKASPPKGGRQRHGTRES